MTPEQAYRVLGLAPGCSEREVSKRFRQLAQDAHPDVGGSGDRFSHLSHAYAVAMQDQVRRESGTVITTHTTSLRGRVRRFRQQARQRLHRLGVGTDPIHPTGGHL